MAERSPDMIAKIVIAMSDTDNQRVHRDILDIATKLPPTRAAEIIPRIIRMLRRTTGIFIHNEIVAVV